GWYRLEGGSGSDLVCLLLGKLTLFCLLQRTHNEYHALSLSKPANSHLYIAPSTTPSRHRILHLHLFAVYSHRLGPHRVPVQRQTVLHPASVRHLFGFKALPRNRLAPARQPAHHPQEQEH